MCRAVIYRSDKKPTSMTFYFRQNKLLLTNLFITTFENTSMRKLLTIIILLGSLQLAAQDSEKKWDLRFGAGVSLLGTGDMTTLNLENEMNFVFNPYLETSLSIAYGRSNSGIYEATSFIQGNLNIFVSPFKNTRRNDFRAGAGISLMNVADAFQNEAECGVGPEQTPFCHFDSRNSFGYNIIIENTYLVTQKFLAGLKLFTQPFVNGDLNSGITLKFGLKF